jgi:membrane protease subunit (stomatin/prohibitin family)
MIIVENGRIVDFCAEPGQYTYNNEVAPSLLGGGMKDLSKSFADVGKRFAAGGGVTNQQKVYFINTKEVKGNKIGWGRVPFRDGEFQMTVQVQGFGMYTFQIADPLMFYKNVAGNVQDVFRKEELIETMKAEVISALQPALNKISRMNISYDMLTGYPREIGRALDEEMSAEWSERRGIDILSLAIESLNVDEASAKKIEKLQEARAMSNPLMAAGRIAASQANAMEDAANNTGGAAMGFMGMGMAGNMGGMNSAELFRQAGAQPQAVPQPPAAAPQPVLKPVNSWVCSCGATCTGKFCNECGKPQPAPAGSWKCSCGTENTGKFCSNCGSPKPAANTPIKCPSCGWEVPEGVSAPKFCSECGGKM